MLLTALSAAALSLPTATQAHWRLKKSTLAYSHTNKYRFLSADWDMEEQPIKVSGFLLELVSILADLNHRGVAWLKGHSPKPMNIFNSQRHSLSSGNRTAKLERTMQVLLIVAALGTCSVVYGQIKKKPAQKGYLGSDPTKIYTSVGAACAEGVKGDIDAHNWTKTDVITCSPTASMTQTQASTASYVGFRRSTENPTGFACLVRFTTTLTLSGQPEPCGSVAGTWFQENTVERIQVGEGRICDLSAGWQMLDETTCYKPFAPYPPARDLPKCGNPTSTGSGCKLESFVLGRIPSGPRNIPVELRYANQFHLTAGQMLGEPSWFLEPADRRLNLRFVASISLARVVSSRGDGSTEEFHSQVDGSYKSFDPQVRLVKTSSTAMPWQRVDYRDGAVELYDGMGRLVNLRYFSGGGFDLSYANATTLLPQRLTTTTGQQVSFIYTDNRLSSVQSPDGSSINLTYQAYSEPTKNIAGSYLKTIAYPDGSSVSFDYVPGMTLSVPLADGAISAEGKQIWGVPADSPSEGNAVDTSDPIEYGRAFFNLSSKTDENGVPYANFQYDDQGRVLSAQHSGNTSRHEFSYQPDQTVVTLPLSPVSTFYMTPSNEQLRLAAINRSAAVLTGGSHTVYFAYDGQGNLSQRIDMGVNNGGDVRAQCMKIDPINNRPTVLLEGASSCPADLATHMPTGGERKTSTKWHPDWRLESRVAQPGQITTLVYNGQPDPTAGNAIASCAPASAKLPDGKPIAVLCKKVERATTDVNGAAGFAATLQSGVAARTWQWTYNQYGQVLTEDGPRTDVTDITNYTYHPATAFTGSGAAAVGVTLGDLASITNAAGKVTQYTQYNKHGQLLQSIDPNGVISSFTYDLRQRPLSSTVGGQTTSYTYDPVGQLKRITRPDASWVGYDYDPAHRQIAAYDNLGNRVDYTLDNAGNKVAESVKDPAGVLKRQLARSMDALGRVQQTTGRE